jgi:hypothetical protein
MSRHRLTWGTVIVGLCVSRAAFAQVPNPTSVEFTPSLDHATLVTTYELGWFPSGVPTPVSVVDIGKPMPNATNVCSASIYLVRPVVGTFTAKIRAVGGEWSAPSNTFISTPVGVCVLSWATAAARVNIYALVAGVPTRTSVVSGVAATVVTAATACSTTAIALTTVSGTGVESALFAPTSAVAR